MPWRRWSGATSRRSISAVAPAWCRRRWPARLPSSPRQASERGARRRRGVGWVAASSAAAVSATRAASSAIWTRPTGCGRGRRGRRRRGGGASRIQRRVDGGGDQKDEEPAEGPGGGGEVGAEGVAGGKDLRGEGGKGGCGEDVAPACRAGARRRRARRSATRRRGGGSGHRVSARRCGAAVAGGAEAAGAAGAVGELAGLGPGDAGDRREHHLGDAHAVGDGDRLGAVVDQDDADLAAVVAVDGAGGCSAASGPGFSARPERGRSWTSWPGGISSARPVGTSARAPGASVRPCGAVAGGEVGAEVHAGGAVGGVGRQRQRRVVAGQAADADGDASCQRPGDAVGERFGGRGLGHARPGLGAVGGDQRHGVLGAAHDAGRRADVVGDDPVGALAQRAWRWRWRRRRRSRRRSRRPAAAGRSARAARCAGCRGSRPARAPAGGRRRPS